MNLKQNTAARDMGLQQSGERVPHLRIQFQIYGAEGTFRNHVRSGYLRSLSCRFSESSKLSKAQGKNLRQLSYGGRMTYLRAGLCNHQSVVLGQTVRPSCVGFHRAHRQGDFGAVRTPIHHHNRRQGSPLKPRKICQPLHGSVQGEGCSRNLLPTKNPGAGSSSVSWKVVRQHTSLLEPRCNIHLDDRKKRAPFFENPRGTLKSHVARDRWWRRLHAAPRRTMSAQNLRHGLEYTCVPVEVVQEAGKSGPMQ